jgi:hypothetical protein
VNLEPRTSNLVTAPVAAPTNLAVPSSRSRRVATGEHRAWFSTRPTLRAAHVITPPRQPPREVPIPWLRLPPPIADTSPARVAPIAQPPSWLTMWPLGLAGLWLALVVVRLVRLGHHRHELDALVQHAAHVPDDVTDKYQPWVLLWARDKPSLNGTRSDIARARRFQQSPDDRLLWFRSNGEEYIIRDPALLAAVEEAFRPLDELGKDQGQLGDQQAKLGDQQAALGERQARLGDEQDQLGEQHAEIAVREQKAVANQLKAAAYAMEDPDGAAATVQQREADRLLDELAREQEGVSRQQAALERRQDALGKQQEALSRKQEELGRTQEALGRKQQEASRRAHRGLIKLLDKALASGTAQKID